MFSLGLSMHFNKYCGSLRSHSTTNRARFFKEG
ncbi:hypothetical protein CLAFUW4_05757 [Fulvia fulva]|nr:uncharacterized protein CLAFUR5_20208 [Fulvia fulva]KAK4624109.1 hypothetical protein CLAFUR4_05751 [Fulvia fulva]KAK4625618.1 hypothetical protein CLAFUR0_05762 [Fulvia fulva]WMI38900.1 hypothetical protein CLAFUR5_20208 [Fulvia fulva]WPV15527.1 hypothetical protein CLAFUW4_05757 [Fulvia fulva]WPV30526.1 hypothetical protein CLAFUW7_05755 [Fulvia fulva]